MRKTAALALAALMLLLAACTREPASAAVTQADASLFAADGAQAARPQTTQAVTETERPTESQTEVQTEARTETQTRVSATHVPFLTTNPPETTLPPENGSASFTAHRFRFYREYGQDFDTPAAVADSRDALDALLTSYSASAYPNSLRADDFAAYTDEWFGTHRLIVVCVQESSGSVGHDVRSVDYTSSGAAVTIKRTVPQVQTCDIAHWLLCIELPDTHLKSGDAVELIWK